MASLSFQPVVEAAHLHAYDDTYVVYELHRNSESNFPPVVFLGGALQDVRSWRKSVERIREFATVVSIDPPGMGAAPPLAPHYCTEFLTNAVASVLDALHCSKICLVGASYGAVIAYRFAQRFPERVHRLCLAGFVGELPQSWRARSASHLLQIREGRLGDFAEEVVSELICKRAKRSKVVERILRFQIARLTQEDAEKYASNVERLMIQAPLDTTPPTTKTLLFSGEHDEFTPPKKIRALARRFDDAVFTTIDDAGHLCMLEQFETLAELIPRFFRDQPLDALQGCSDIEVFSA